MSHPSQSDPSTTKLHDPSRQFPQVIPIPHSAEGLLSLPYNDQAHNDLASQPYHAYTGHHQTNPAPFILSHQLHELTPQLAASESPIFLSAADRNYDLRHEPTQNGATLSPSMFDNMDNNPHPHDALPYQADANPFVPPHHPHDPSPQPPTSANSIFLQYYNQIDPPQNHSAHDRATSSSPMVFDVNGNNTHDAMDVNPFSDGQPQSSLRPIQTNFLRHSMGPDVTMNASPSGLSNLSNNADDDFDIVCSPTVEFVDVGTAPSLSPDPFLDPFGGTSSSSDYLQVPLQALHSPISPRQWSPVFSSLPSTPGSLHPPSLGSGSYSSGSVTDEPVTPDPSDPTWCTKQLRDALPSPAPSEKRLEPSFRRRVGSQATKHASYRRRKKTGDHRCPFPRCDSTFTAPHNLKHHVNSHWNLRKYRCTGCDQAFVTSHVRSRHLKTCRPRP